MAKLKTPHRVIFDADSEFGGVSAPNAHLHTVIVLTKPLSSLQPTRLRAEQSAAAEGMWDAAAIDLRRGHHTPTRVHGQRTSSVAPGVCARGLGVAPGVCVRGLRTIRTMSDSLRAVARRT